MKIINHHSIAILMATYNGAKYLEEQLQSLYSQTCKDWTLYIQDDGSSDDTVQIIKKHVNQRENVVHVDNGLTRQGAGMNFMSLLNVVESTYYMFCDQDDVWLPQKIQISLERMQEERRESPIIIHTDRTFVDSNLNIIQKSDFNPHNIPNEKLTIKLQKLKNPNILAITTIVGGCTMLFNRAVKDLVFPFINVRVHDSVCAMAVAGKRGKIITITESTMLYRLHGSNTCGVSGRKIIPKIVNFIDSYKNNMRLYYIWRIYGKGTFLKFLYYQIKYFLILRCN
jgi:rhamnosyltransferase